MNPAAAVRARLAVRANSEHEQALLRIAIIGLVTVFMSGRPPSLAESVAAPDQGGPRATGFEGVRVTFNSLQSDKQMLSHRAKKTFNQPTFLRSQHPLVPLIKIREISATVELYPKVYENFGAEASSSDQ